MIDPYDIAVKSFPSLLQFVMIWLGATNMVFRAGLIARARTYCEHFMVTEPPCINLFVSWGSSLSICLGLTGSLCTIILTSSNRWMIYCSLLIGLLYWVIFLRHITVGRVLSRIELLFISSFTGFITVILILLS